jgi:hypothetical protein
MLLTWEKVLVHEEEKRLGPEIGAEVAGGECPNTVWAKLEVLEVKWVAALTVRAMPFAPP